jgi:hypothetical protein
MCRGSPTEEAARALFRDDRRRFGELVAGWPEDVRDHAIKLAFADLDPSLNQLRRLSPAVDT